MMGASQGDLAVPRPLPFWRARGCWASSRQRAGGLLPPTCPRLFLAHTDVTRLPPPPPRGCCAQETDDLQGRGTAASPRGPPRPHPALAPGRGAPCRLTLLLPALPPPRCALVPGPQQAAGGGCGGEDGSFPQCPAPGAVMGAAPAPAPPSPAPWRRGAPERLGTPGSPDPAPLLIPRMV